MEFNKSFVSGWFPLALRSAMICIDDGIHVRGVFVELPVLAYPQPVPDRKSSLLLHRPAKAADHAGHEGVGFFAIEGVEPVAEAAQAYGVERETGHLRRHVYLFVGVEPLPLLHQLLRDVSHHREVVPDGPHAEVG
jgi:hypothetical protein